MHWESLFSSMKQLWLVGHWNKPRLDRDQVIMIIFIWIQEAHEGGKASVWFCPYMANPFLFSTANIHRHVLSSELPLLGWMSVWMFSCQLENLLVFLFATTQHNLLLHMVWNKNHFRPPIITNLQEQSLRLASFFFTTENTSIWFIRYIAYGWIN